MFWSTLGRIIIVPLAFAIAAAATLAVLLSLGYERAVHALSGSEAPERIDAVFDLIGSGFMIASAMTILPALAVAIVGEVARIRSALFYILGGGAAMAIAPLMARFGQQPDSVTGALWPIFATAGFAGGLVYWMLAGRKA